MMRKTYYLFLQITGLVKKLILMFFNRVNTHINKSLRFYSFQSFLQFIYESVLKLTKNSVISFTKTMLGVFAIKNYNY